ncbi:MAG: undecaprenyl-diphosphate phosphatase [Salaquimonas sp.]|jgi:undecaprenyl-diphosphatase|nr:undecaprenyl-diphosphate phosphatase [Salaquimonas sp.]
MSFIYILFLAIVQGITEFLPISSSAHLILGRDLMEALGLAASQGTAADQLAFDISLHVGTLFAVIVYFWRDIAEMILGFFDGITGKGGQRFHLLVMVIVATIPIVIIGFLAKDLVTHMLRSTEIIAWMTLIFAFVLWAADRVEPTRETTSDITLGGALIVGFMQCLAIVPGVSRSGITMTAGRYLGFDRPLSARFALLLSVPTIAAAGMLVVFDLYEAGDAHLTADALVGGVLSFVSALTAIALMMRWLRHASYMPFIVYRVALGILLLVLIYGFGWAPVQPA